MKLPDRLNNYVVIYATFLIEKHSLLVYTYVNMQQQSCIHAWLCLFTRLCTFNSKNKWFSIKTVA